MTGVLLKHFIINLFPTFRRSTMSGNIYFKYYFTVYSQALKFRTILFIYLFKQYLIIQPFTIFRGWTLWCGQTARRKALHLHLIYDHWTKKDNHHRYHLLSNEKKKKWLQYILYTHINRSAHLHLQVRLYKRKLQEGSENRHNLVHSCL